MAKISFVAEVTFKLYHLRVIKGIALIKVLTG